MKHSKATQEKLTEKVVASLQNDDDRWEFSPDRCVVAEVPGKRSPRRAYQLKSGVVVEMLADNVYIRVGELGGPTTDVELEEPFASRVRLQAQMVFRKKKAEFEERRLKEEARLYELLDL